MMMMMMMMMVVGDYSGGCGGGDGSVCVFVGEVKDYINRAEQLKQLLKPNHADTSDGAPPPHELGLLYSRSGRHSFSTKFICTLWKFSIFC